MKKIFWLLLIINVLLLAFIIVTFEPNPPPPLLPKANVGNIQIYTEPLTVGEEAQK